MDETALMEHWSMVRIPFAGILGWGERGQMGIFKFDPTIILRKQL